MKDILNKTSAPNIVKFFDVCFKRGVIEACNRGNDMVVKEFYDNHWEQWDFGVIDESEDFDWRFFRLYLYRWAREAKMGSFAENYIYRITNKSINWCFLLLCMRFYLLGISEWLEYPNQVGIELFRTQPKIHWKPVPRHLKKITKPDVLTTMQECAFAVSKMDDAQRPISPALLDGFCLAIYDLTKKYGRKKDSFR